MAADPVLKAFLKAMQKAGKIKPGGRLVFINRKTGSAMSSQPQPDVLPQAGNQ